MTLYPLPSLWWPSRWWQTLSFCNSSELDFSWSHTILTPHTSSWSSSRFIVDFALVAVIVFIEFATLFLLHLQGFYLRGAPPHRSLIPVVGNPCYHRRCFKVRWDDDKGSDDKNKMAPCQLNCKVTLSFTGSSWILRSTKGKIITKASLKKKQWSFHKLSHSLFWLFLSCVIGDSFCFSVSVCVCLSLYLSFSTHTNTIF